LDRELVVRAQRGEEAAFAALAVRSSDRLHATAFHILRDKDLAADAVQQTMIEVWRKLPQLRDPDTFLAWAYRIVIRAAYAEGKRRSAFRVRANLVVTRPSSSAGTSAQVDDRDQLDRAFARLTLEQRAVLVLKHYAGLSNLEIAATLEVPEGTVRSRLHHAMQALRAGLDADRRSAEPAR
jgi:RNA polymerase sigma-70 factor (ECF subfamily)